MFFKFFLECNLRISKLEPYVLVKNWLHGSKKSSSIWKWQVLWLVLFFPFEDDHVIFGSIGIPVCCGVLHVHFWISWYGILSLVFKIIPQPKSLHFIYIILKFVLNDCASTCHLAEGSENLVIYFTNERNFHKIYLKFRLFVQGGWTLDPPLDIAHHLGEPLYCHFSFFF